MDRKKLGTRMICLPALLLGFSVMTACQLIDPEIPESTPREARLSVDDTSILRQSIPGSLFGMNVEWIEKANGMADGNGNFAARWVNAGREAVDHVRWPGGIFSDYYHWTDGVGPVSGRPARSHHTDDATEVDVIGTPGIARYADSIGGSLLMTVNAGSGTSAEAADWVRYCLAPGDARRLSDGFSGPLPIGWWEVGNELYLQENPGTPKVAMGAAQYTTIFNDFAGAMRASVPGTPIKLVAISESSASWFPLYDANWLATLLAGAAAQIDLVAVHNSYAPYLYSAAEAAKGTREVYQAMWAAPEAIAESYDRLAATISSAETSHGLPAGKIGLAVTEWGPLFGMDRRWVDNGKTLGSALFVARMFQVMAERDRVRLAEAFKFTDSFTQGWIGFDGTAKPIWEVFKLMARQKGNAVVGSRLSGPGTYSSTRVGGIEARRDVLELTSLASVSADGKTMWISLVNRAWSQPYSLALELPAAWQSARASTYTLSGSLVTNHNGPDVQSWIPAILYYDDPFRHGPVPLATADLGTGRTVSLPNHSVVFVRLER